MQGVLDLVLVGLQARIWETEFFILLTTEHWEQLRESLAIDRARPRALRRSLRGEKPNESGVQKRSKIDSAF